MDVARVVGLLGVVLVGVVVHLGHLVAAVDDRQAGLREQVGVEHDVLADGDLHRLLVALEARRRGGAEAGVAGHRVGVVELAARGAARHAALEVVVEVALVRNLLHAPGAERGVVEAPADVVVAAQVVEEGVLAGQAAHGVELRAQQARVAARHRVPGGGHRCDVVEHVALGLFHGPEIGDHLHRRHDHLAQEHDAGAHDLADHAHHAHDRVDLGEVAAVGAELLPDVGHGVDADDVHALVGQVEEVVHHLVEDARVAIVEVPLVGVELRHHGLAQLRQVGEVAGRRGGEDLRHVAGVLVDHRLVALEEVPAHVLALAGTRPPRPLVLLRGVVHDEVHAEADAALVALPREVGEVLHRPELGLDATEVPDGVAAVRAAPVRGGVEERHEVEVVHAHALEVVQAVLHAPDVPGEVVDVHLHAEHVAAAIPLSGGLSLGVEGAQPLGARVVVGPHLVEQLGEHVAVVIELHVEPAELVVVPGQALLEDGVGPHALRLGDARRGDGLRCLSRGGPLGGALPAGLLRHDGSFPSPCAPGRIVAAFPPGDGNDSVDVANEGWERSLTRAPRGRRPPAAPFSPSAALRPAAGPRLPPRSAFARANSARCVARRTDNASTC